MGMYSLRDHAFHGNTDVTENTDRHGNVIANVNVKSVFVIQATLPVEVDSLRGSGSFIGCTRCCKPPNEKFGTLFMR